MCGFAPPPSQLGCKATSDVRRQHLSYNSFSGIGTGSPFMSPPGITWAERLINDAW